MRRGIEAEVEVDNMEEVEEEEERIDEKAEKIEGRKEEVGVENKEYEKLEVVERDG